MLFRSATVTATPITSNIIPIKTIIINNIIAGNTSKSLSATEDK